MIEPYTSSPTCAKCRRTNPQMRYGRLLDSDSHVNIMLEEWPARPELFHHIFGHLPECLQMTCVRCGHVWLTQTAETKIPKAT